MKFKFCTPKIKSFLSENPSFRLEYKELEDIMDSLLEMANDENSPLYTVITYFFENGDEILKKCNIDSTDYNVPNSSANVTLCDFATEYIAKEIFSIDCLYVDELWGVELDRPLSEVIECVDSVSEKNEDVVVFVKAIASLIAALLFSTINKIIFDFFYKKYSKSIYSKLNEMVSKKEESVQETNNFS